MCRRRYMRILAGPHENCETTIRVELGVSNAADKGKESRSNKRRGTPASRPTIRASNGPVCETVRTPVVIRMQ